MEAGTRVRLKDGARHSASTDDWRETLKNLEGKEGTVDKVFDSGHTNVMFDVDGGHMIGIDRKYLVRAEHL
jgi:hypothetical protein